MQWNIEGSWGKFVTHLWVSLLSRIMYYVTFRQRSKTIGPYIFSSFIVFLCKKSKPIISYLIMTVEEKPFEIKKKLFNKMSANHHVKLFFNTDKLDVFCLYKLSYIFVTRISNIWIQKLYTIWQLEVDWIISAHFQFWNLHFLMNSYWNFMKMVLFC